MSSKVCVAVTCIGSFVAVDDLGSTADATGNVLGTSLVCRVGVYGYDKVNNVSSSV